MSDYILVRSNPTPSLFRSFPIDPQDSGTESGDSPRSFPDYASILESSAPSPDLPEQKLIKIYSYSIVSIPLANPVVAFESPWSDEGIPNAFKRFRKLIVEVDNQNSGTVTITPEIDGVALTSFTITAPGRQETVYSFPVDTTGYIWRIRSTTTTTARFYGVRVEMLPDPTHVKTYESAWSNEGTINRKRFRDVIIDIDTVGNSVDVIPWIDGVALTAIAVTTTTRDVKVLSLPVDTTGKLIRVTTSGNNFHTVYAHRITYTEEPHFGTIRETVWTDEGYPYDKLWKHMTVDLDTGGQTVTLSLWIDGVVSDTFSITTAGRELRTLSINADTLGKLGRITTANQDAQIFGVKFVCDNEPPDLTFVDSYEQTFGYDGWKVLKRMWAAVKCDSTVTALVYADEVLVDTLTFTPTISQATGYGKIRADLGTAIKGKLFRFKFSAANPFKLYWEKSQVEMKMLNKDDGWALYKFNPPQIM